MTLPQHPSFSQFIKSNYSTQKEQEFLFSLPPERVIAILKEKLVQPFEFSSQENQSLPQIRQHIQQKRKILKLRKRQDVKPTSFHPMEEVSFERLLIGKDATLFNQFAFDGHIALDFIRAENNTITHLFELKTGSNDLRYAVYELAYYYLLLRKACKQKLPLLNEETRTPVSCARRLKLCVLLPDPHQMYDPDNYKFRSNYPEDPAFLQAVQEALRPDGHPILYRKNLPPHWREYIAAEGLYTAQELAEWLPTLYEP